MPEEDSSPKTAGRPRKVGKLKISHTIVATGKGRGRPKRPPPSAEELKAIIAKGEITKKKIKRSKGPIGRPRKEKGSSDEENDDDEPGTPRPVGRPNTGAPSLNIVRTGRGQGRPKNKKVVKPPKTSYNKGSAKKVGRPSKGGVGYVCTGKPRGRPKAGAKKAEEKEQSDDEAEEEEDKDEESE